MNLKQNKEFVEGFGKMKINGEKLYNYRKIFKN